MEPDEKDIETGKQSLLDQCLHFLSVISLVVSLATYLFNLWVSRLVPSLSADSLIYHLTIPAFWTQRGFLQTVDLPFHDGAAEHSPLLTETLLYGLMKLTGNDDLAFLVQPAFFLLTVALFHRTVRLIGLRIVTARLLTAFVLLFSPFFHSSLIVNSEMVMTCGVAAFCYGMLLTRERREAGWYVAAAGIALTLASKTVGIIYGGFALLVLIGWLIAARRGAEEEAQPLLLRRMSAICAAIVLCGLAFHFRNLWLHGNPLYPAELRILGLRILPGRYNASIFISHGWSPVAFRKMLLYDTESYAMNKQFGVVLWAAMLVPLGLFSIRRLKPADLLPTALFVFYPLSSILVYFAVVPFWSEHRLLFPIYYLLWGGLGWSLHLLTREASDFTQCLAAAAVGLVYIAYALFFLLFDEVPLVLLIAAGVLGLVFANYPRILEWNWRLPWAAPAAVVAAFVISSPWWYLDLSQQRAKGRGSAYSQTENYGSLGEAWNRLAELTATKPATIAYSGNALIYPLLGSRHTNRVVYLPIHPQDQPSPLTFTKGETIYRQLARQRRAQADEKYWLEQLREQEVDYLLLVQDPKFDGALVERTFAAHNPRLLRLIFEHKDVWIYALQRD
ncbi:MAG: hypothetical protein IAF94_11710 [Pirellulaceae bacterium]|nr:hypothetical protein [Pirellulaceae bacterium]